MEKEKVLEIKIVKMNDEFSVACITYQNTEVLKRGEFADEMLNVKSNNHPSFDNEDMAFYLRGSSECSDNVSFNIKNDNVSYLLNKVDIINEKYGIVKRWRAEKYGSYYCLNSELDINKYVDHYTISDRYRYRAGNYFQTEEEAREYADKIRKLLQERE